MPLAALAAALVAVCMVPTAGRAALQTNSVVALAPNGVAPEPNGYPFWYQDFNGVQLGPCVDLIHCPVGTGLTGAQDGFEAFYWIIDAPPTLPNGGVYRAALEGATLANPVSPGGVDRNVFFRVRFRMDVTVPGDYTLVHPFGTKTYTGVAAGIKAINDTIDLGLVPNDFNAVIPVFGAGTPTPAFPNGAQFMTWDATLPLAPAGFIGDFAIPHPITPGPNGAALTITGPAGAFGATNTFTTTDFLLGGTIQGPARPNIYTADKAAALTMHRNSGSVAKVLEYVDPNGGPLTAAVTGLPSFCTSDTTVANKVTITCTPTAATAQATTPVTLTVTDSTPGTPLQDAVTFDVVVDNQAPIIAAVAPTTVDSTSAAPVVIPVTVSDPDGNDIVGFTATLTPAPSDSSWFTFTRTGPTAGQIVIQGPIPVVDGNKIYSVDVHVTDNGSPTRFTEGSASIQVNIPPTVAAAGGSAAGGSGGCSTGAGTGLALLLLAPVLVRRRVTAQPRA